MTKMVLMAALMAGTFAAVAARAAEPAGYELDGFPITRHQVAVVGTSRVKEQSPVPALTVGGMPASPSQLAILRAHQITASMTVLAAPLTVVTK